MQRVRSVLSIQRSFIRIGLVRKSQFRVEFLNQVLMDLCFYASFILTFEILYGLGTDGPLTLAGWTAAETRVYLGFAFVSDALMMTFLGQQWHFGQDLKNGALDSYRVRPGGVEFLYFFQRFSPEGFTNMVFAFAWLGFAIAGVMPEQVQAATLVWALPLGLVLVAFTQVAMTLFYNSFELWFVHSDTAHLANMVLGNLCDRPLEVYPSALSRVLKFILPVAGMVWFPASLILGRLEPTFIALYPLVLLAFGAVALGIFRRGLRRYESALS